MPEQHHTGPLWAVLLAAGRGARIGGPKALCQLGDRTFLQHAARALRDGGAADAGLTVVVADAAHAGDVGTDVTVLVNPHPERGQASSIHLALRSARPPGLAGCVLHTVDHPLVRAEDVRRLVAAFRARPAGCRLVVPSVGGRRGHPLLMDEVVANELAALDPNEPAHVVVRRDPARIHHAVLENPWLVRDVDTPADLEDARAALANRNVPLT